MKILFVDDAPGIQKTMKLILKEIGYSDTIIVGSAEAALDILRKEEVDLLIADIHMPVISGIELVQKTRQELKKDKLPILMLTADAFEGTVRQAAQAGANDYLVKPFTEASLKAKIEKLIRHGETQEKAA